MPNPSYWTFRRNNKWHSGWRDEHNQCRSKAQAVGATRALAEDYARNRALEACGRRAGRPVTGKDIRAALETFLRREDVKSCTHELNRRHLESFLDHLSLRTVDQLTTDAVHDWL